MSELSRREFLSLLAAGATGAAGAALAKGGAADRLAELASEIEPSTARGLQEIEHVVIVMQENRSFDHYFGVLSAVRGYSDPNVRTQKVGGRTYPVFDQFGYEPGKGVTRDGFLQPFHLVSDPPRKDGETTNDITHSWAPQHESWNDGAMDRFVSTHLAADGTSNGPVTMGYFDRADLAFY